MGGGGRLLGTGHPTIDRLERPLPGFLWLGLTPNDSSSGQRRRFGGINKRGDRYLRIFFIHGAMAYA